MGSFNYIKFQEGRFLESWEIFKMTGDIFDAMEFMSDLRDYDLLKQHEDHVELE